MNESDLHVEKDDEPRISISCGMAIRGNLNNFELICDDEHQEENDLEHRIENSRFQSE
jgi:hypothetical protein